MTAELLTIAEQSRFVRTGRSDEVERLCAAFARQWPHQVHVIEYGRSAEGRAMLALLVTRTGISTPQQALTRKIPVFMIQAGIHPGESDGKDAGFIALREMLAADHRPSASVASAADAAGAATATSAADVLERIAVLFVPAFNVDGHERFRAWNRPNQSGPHECGWRATAQNLNLNRDYAKADAPEMRAMLRLINQWEPLLCADLHVTDGADFEPDVSIQAEPVNQGDLALRRIGVALRGELIARLTQRGSIALPFYPDLARVDDPTSGFLVTVYSPRFSTGYFPQRNRFTVLVETHSWKPYAQRVRVTRNAIDGLAEMLAVNGEYWLAEAHAADERMRRGAGECFELDYESAWREPTGTAAATRDEAVELIDFRGYAYTRLPSSISGTLVTVYDPTTPQIWRVPLRSNTAASMVVRAPRAGYVIPASFAASIAERLDAHGIQFNRLAAAAPAMSTEAFRATAVQISAGLFEGRTRVQLQGEWRPEATLIPAGSLFVPIAQPLARLVMALLEPKAPDSFASWGLFNACFEQKECLEPYVAEQIARTMLAADPALLKEWERRLREDAAFAASPSARVAFFLERHESWDERYNLYPILRVDQLG